MFYLFLWFLIYIAQQIIIQISATNSNILKNTANIAAKSAMYSIVITSQFAMFCNLNLYQIICCSDIFITYKYNMYNPSAKIIHVKLQYLHI